MQNTFVELGKVVGVWGVKGWIKLHSYTRKRADIAQYKTWYLARHKKGPERDAEPKSVKVLQCREQAKGIVALIDGIDDRDEAALLSGLGIWIKQSDLPVLPEGEFYWQQLIGLTVANKTSEIGKVQSILETGANDVLVCKPLVSGSPDVLIPYTDDVVIEVNLEAGSMLVDWDPDYLKD